jgi:Glycosyltransferases involved in cell wall biogenesis
LNARATVIIPTYGEAHFAEWAIKSVQQQTVQDIDICIICDGSPQHMVDFFKDLAQEDSRIQVFSYPKSPRTGEPYRDEVIRRTNGRIICYCCHDDLWLPNYIETVEEALAGCCFVHSFQAIINPPEKIGNEDSIIWSIQYVDMENSQELKRMDDEIYGFGLTFGAHTKAAYDQLKEGWVTTPDPNIHTDMYMWRKFVALQGEKFKTITKIIALNLQKPSRIDWTENERDQELKFYFEKLKDKDFLRYLEEYPAKNLSRKLKFVKSDLRAARHELQNLHLKLQYLENELIPNLENEIIPNLKNEKNNELKEKQSWIEVATERLQDILAKQKQIDSLNLQLAACNDKINDLIPQTSMKRQIVLRIKKVLPKPFLKLFKHSNDSV